MLIKILFFVLLSIGLISSNLNAQHHRESKSKNKSMLCCCSNNENHSTSSDQMDSSYNTQHKHSEKNLDSSTKSTIVRDGIIDLIKIDQNKDGFVYQCPMDLNVISDKFERCPICEMKLKKISVEKAKESLQKHRFKVKE